MISEPISRAARVSIALLLLPLSSLAQEPPGGRETRAPREEAKAAQPSSTEAQLPDLVVTATRTPSPLSQLPFEVELVRGKELLLRRNVQDAIARLPAVTLQRTSAGQTSPYLRGLTGYHTLLMVDGVRLNTSVLRSGPNEYWALVDPFSTDSLEVVFGPGAVLYGSDAVGGTVNALPRRRREFAPGWNFSPRVVLRAASGEEAIGGRVELAGNHGEHLGFVLGTSWNRQGELSRGGSSGQQRDTDYWNAFGDAHLEWRFDDRWSLRLLTQNARLNDVNRVHRTTAGVSFLGTSIGSDRRRRFDWERDLALVKLEGRGLPGFADQLDAFVSYQRLTEARERIRGDGRRDEQGFEVHALGAGVNLASQTPIGRLTYGFDYYREWIDSYQRSYDAAGGFTGSRVQGPVGDDATYDLLGVFIQDEIPFGDDFRVLLGARGTYAAADIGRALDLATGNPFSIDDSWWNAIGSARALYEGLEGFQFFAGASQGFRAPNLSDLSRLDQSGTNWVEIPSADLDPENFVNFDVGVRVNRWGLRAEAVWFYTILDDVITRAPTGQVDPNAGALVTKRNSGDGHVHGISLQAAYTFFDEWTAFGRFSWTDGQQDVFRDLSVPDASATTEVISRLPPLNGAIGMRYEPLDQDFFVEAEAVLYDEQDRLSTRDRADGSRIPAGGTPGWATFNLRGGYEFDPQKIVVLELQNLLDKDYRLHGSGVQEPGFNAVLAVDLTF